jgi:hypothetical protein
MADWSTPLASLLTIGSSAGLLGLAKYIQDERTHRAERRRLRRAEEREDGEEPLKVEELHLGLVSQATAIQQRMIDTQKQQIQDLDLRYELLKTDSDRQIGAMPGGRRPHRWRVGALLPFQGHQAARVLSPCRRRSLSGSSRIRS